MSEHKISFAKTPGAGHSAPVEQPKTAEAPPAASAESPAASKTEQLSVPSGNANSLGFYDGSEEMPESTAGDKRTPWLGLIQPTTKDKTVNGTPVVDGTFVYKRAVALGKSFRAVVVGFKSKVYVEKLKYVQNPGPNDPKARIASTLQEVLAFGGTDVWKLSNQNKDRNDIPLYQTPYFGAHITGLILIECPAGTDDSHFPFVSDGKAYAPALFEFKGASFSSGFVPINTERGLSFKGKWTSRFVTFTSRQGAKNPSWFVVTRVGEPTSEALQAFIASELR